MTTPCPACGAVRLQSLADHYAVEVLRADCDPEALAWLDPPLRVSILPGTASITLFFLAVLAPGFVPSGRELMVFLTFFILGAASFLLWLRTLVRFYGRVAKSNFPFVDCMLSPLGLPLFCLLLYRSWFQHKVLKRVSWKGRSFGV